MCWCGFVSLRVLIIDPQVLEYAIHYRQVSGAPDTYSKYITRQACNCIVHNTFMFPVVDWTIVEFYTSCCESTHTHNVSCLCVLGVTCR